VPQMNTDTRTYRNDVGPDTGPHRNELDTDTWLHRNGISPSTWLDQGGYSPDTWPYQNGFGPDARTRRDGSGRSAAGRNRLPARHRKPPSRRMRRAATATAIVLAGGGAAVGLLYATGPQPLLTAADQNAHAVTSATRPGGAAGASTTLATPAAAGAPANAYVPRHAASSGKHAAMIEKTVTATGPAGPTAGRSVSPSSSASSPSASSPSPSSPSASSPGTSPSASPTQPTPTSTASAPASTPATPPPTSAGSGTCADPSFTTSSAFGGETLGAYTISNDMWNAGGGGISQTLSACSAGNWSVDADVADDEGGVKTYPNSAYNFADPPEISSLASVTSTFGSSLPASGDFEDAYDIWLNGTASGGGGEVMIWTDNHGQTPAGSPLTTVTFDGQSYTVWQAAGGPVTFVSDTNVTGGDLNLLQFFQWLVSQGLEPSNSTLNQVAYGAEIVSTNAAPETFGFDNFSVSSS
jgi:glycosyl hydrolase family 12